MRRKSAAAAAAVLAFAGLRVHAAAFASRDGDFSLALPRGDEPRFIPWVNLDIVGWEKAGDHSVAGAAWRMNGDVFTRFSGSAEEAARFLRSTHSCGDRVCGSTEVTTRELPGGGVLSFYELRDPSVPADRGVLSGIARVGGDLYRVQGVNYDPKKSSREDLLGVLMSLRAPAAADARPVPAPEGGGDGDDWGIRFSGESDLSLMQDMHSSAPAPEPPPAKKPEAPPVKIAPAPKKPETLPPPAAPKPKKPAAAQRPAAKPVKRRAPAAKPAAPPAPKESFPALPPVPVKADAAAPPLKFEDLDERLQHDALPDLIEMLRHENPRVRARVADLIGQRGEAAAAAVPRLTENLDDKDARSRSSAAMALGNIGAPARAAIPKLKALANDPNPDARLSAREALERLGAP